MWVFVCPGEECEGNACGYLSVPERSARVMHGGICLSREECEGNVWVSVPERSARVCMWVFVCPGEECEGNACMWVHVGVCLSRRGVRG